MAQDQFNRLGHPGRFVKSVEVTSGETWFTGSNFGASGVIRGTGASGSLHLSNGGTISLEDLDAGFIHELGIERVSGIGGGSVYILSFGN